MIPSEMELAARYKVSQGTVRKMIDELAAENLVTRHQGKGTFVTMHYKEGVQLRPLYLMPEQSEQYYPNSHVLECRRMCASAEAACPFGLKAGDSVMQIRRILLLSGEPTTPEEIWLPGVSFKGLTVGKLTEWKSSMHAFFEAEFGVRILRTTERIRAVITDPAMAELLSIAAESPLLSVERVSHMFGDKPVEIRRGLHITT